MVHREAIKVGAVLFVDVYPENREYGYNPAPDGTPVTVVSATGATGEGWPVCRLPSGDTQQISRFHLSATRVNEARYRSSMLALSRFMTIVTICLQAGWDHYHKRPMQASTGEARSRMWDAILAGRLRLAWPEGRSEP